MTQDETNKLRQALLKELFGFENTLGPGDSVEVQPKLENQPQYARTISVPGYDWEQIDFQLREMCRHGLISSGTAQYDAPAIGIFFSNLTPFGRDQMT